MPGDGGRICRAFRTRPRAAASRDFAQDPSESISLVGLLSASARRMSAAISSGSGKRRMSADFPDRRIAVAENASGFGGGRCGQACGRLRASEAGRAPARRILTNDCEGRRTP